MGRSADQHDLVVVAGKDQRWHVEFLEIFSEVRLGKGLNAVEGVLEPALHVMKQNMSRILCETSDPDRLAL